MDWRKLIEATFSQTAPNGYAITPVFYAPVTQDAIEDTESILGVSLPSELKALLTESNGVNQQMQTSTFDTETGYLIWPVEKIRQENLSFRSNAECKNLYMPFECLLFFADAGNGDTFAYAILNGQVRQTDIFVWNHEDDSRRWVAPSLHTFIEWWLTGKIKV